MTGNDEGLLVGKPVAFKPSGKHIDLGLTGLDAKTFADVRLESWNVLGWYKYIGYDTNDKVIGIEAEVEIDIWRLR